jgi:hypothetical protein
MNTQKFVVWLPELHWIPVDVKSDNEEEALDLAYQKYHNADLSVRYGDSDNHELLDGAEFQPHIEKVD